MKKERVLALVAESRGIASEIAELREYMIEVAQELSEAGNEY